MAFRGRTTGSTSRTHGASEEVMLQSNNSLIDDISKEVSMLKQFSIEIQKETQEHNDMLDEMSKETESVQGKLKASLRTVLTMIETGGGKYMCHLILFVALFFLAVYWFLIK